MSSKTSKDLFVFELFRNKDINYSTIDCLLKYGFDSDESLLSLDFDVDFPQMPDICLSQKCLLRQLLTDFRKNYNKTTDNWNQEKQNLISSHESDDSLSEKTNFDNNSNIIFLESESIVKQIKELILRQNKNYIKQQNDNNFNKVFDISFDPIVDQLRESLIKVEKQKQEKDVILQKQRIELLIKDLEIQSLQNERKSLESQLICEKMKVEKLEYKLKSNKTENTFNRKFDNNFKTDNNIKSLDQLKKVYYNSLNNNNEYECEQSSGTEGQSPIRDQVFEKKNFVNYWNEVETNAVKNKNCDQFKSSLFTDYVSKQSTGSSDSADNMVFIDSEPNDDSTSTSAINQINFKTSCKKLNQNLSNEQKVSEEDDCSETNGNNYNLSDVESIVCEPDFETHSAKTSFKPKVHLKVQNNRIVVNSLNSESSVRTNIQKKIPNRQIKGEYISPSSVLKQYQCSYDNCSFSFVSSEGLKRHIRSVHTKEKPFKCHYEDCNKCFGRSDALKEHMKRHLGLKLFKCSYSECDFESVSSNSLKRHIISIHLKEKHFKCQFENCNKTFGRKDSLKKHMEKQHQITDQY